MAGQEILQEILQKVQADAGTPPAGMKPAGAFLASTPLHPPPTSQGFSILNGGVDYRMKAVAHR